MKVESIIKEAKLGQIKNYRKNIEKLTSKANVNLGSWGLLMILFSIFVSINLITKIFSIFIFSLSIYFLFNFFKKTKEIKNYEKIISLSRRV